MGLFRKELGRVFFSLAFVAALAGILIFLYSQSVLPGSDKITAPEPGGPYGAYGMKDSGDPALIMPEAAEMLYIEYSSNQYTTYPNGFIKYVKLNEADRIRMSEILAELSVDRTGNVPSDSGPENGSGSNETSFGVNNSIEIDGDDLQSMDRDGNNSIQIYTSADDPLAGFQFDTDIGWERFSELMAEADKLLGGGSDYSETWISHRFGQVPVTYEEALADYELTITYDQYTGTHARLFCDYAGIILALLPVFPAAFLMQRDRKRIAPVLYTRQIGSARLILTRYAALVMAIMLPLLVIGAVLTSHFAGLYGAENIDVFAFLKYLLGWVLPTVMASTAVGLFFTALAGAPIAIGVQFVWWFADSMGVGGSGAYSFLGVRPLQLAPRHNALGDTAVFMEYAGDLLQNRVWISLIALALVWLTVLVFMAKRRGFLNVSVFKRGGV